MPRVRKLIEYGFSAEEIRYAVIEQGGTEDAADYALRTMAPTALKKLFDPNEVPALVTKLSDLVTLWEAKFGDRWVRKSALEEDLFWNAAMRRLLHNALLETLPSDFPISNTFERWFRLKEHA